MRPIAGRTTALAAVVWMAGASLAVAGQAAVVAPGAQAAAREKRVPAAKAAADAAAAVMNAPKKEVEARHWLSHTAVWTGEPVDYVVEIDAEPSVELLHEDLSIDKIKTTGLEAKTVDYESAPTPEGRVLHTLRYHLVSFETGPENPKIDALTIRYRNKRANQPTSGVAAASELVVPGMEVSWRSALPDDMSELGMRTATPLVGSPWWLEFARPVGIALLVVSVAPVVFWIFGLVHYRHSIKPKRRPSRAKGEARSLIESARSHDLSTAQGRLAAYDALDHGLREYLSHATDVPARALTPSELAQRLPQGKHGLQAEVVATALKECEDARYSAPARLPAADQIERTISALEQALPGAAR